MRTSKTIPDFTNLKDMADFWDTHSLDEYWDSTEPAEFELADDFSEHFLVALDPGLLAEVHRLANKRGVSTESLVNLFVEQRLREVKLKPA